jgi:hypothetical protein
MSNLAIKNAHPRDSHISFDEPTHIYTINGSSKGVISVTKLLGSFHPKFDADKVIRNMKASPKWPDSPYFGMTDAAIKQQWTDNGTQASGAGTGLHLAIEQFLDKQEITDRDVVTTQEWSYFQAFWLKHEPDLEPYRLEWCVYVEELKLAGSIDAVFRRKSDGAFFIYDWKRCKKIETENRFETCLAPVDHLPNSNYWHYTLQLNTYRYILERHYGMVIKDMFLIILHPNNETYMKRRLNRMDAEVEAMMDVRRSVVQRQ